MDDTNGGQKPSRIGGVDIYDCREIDAADLSGYENAIWDLFKRKYDCLIVRGALDAETCKCLAEGATKLPTTERSSVTGGWTFPPIFYKLAEEVANCGAGQRKQVLGAYFERCAQLANEYSNLLSVDIRGLTHKWLRALAGGCNVEIPKGLGSNGEYAGMTLRSFFGGGQGQITLQCGNYLQTVHQHFYEHLEGQVDVFDQLSFFFFIQAPQAGGEVCLFDLEWEEGQTKSSLSENVHVMLPEISFHTASADLAQILNPEVGDLVIFAAAGQIWHRVEPVLGERERITLGGFAAYSYDKKTVYHWS